MISFFQVTGYLVYGTGQPTKVGFQNALDKIFAANDSAVKKVLWTSMRQVRAIFESIFTAIILESQILYMYIVPLIFVFQEPVVYMNGESFTPRFPDK